MVYEKAKSGDPDYDDKQPIGQHGGRLVTSPDGREVLMSDVLGPVDRYTGEHVDMTAKADAGDNRPAPGEVATEASSVQTYSVEDTPAADRTDDADAVQPDAPVADKAPAKSRTTK
jgi:hypothetical protein